MRRGDTGRPSQVPRNALGSTRGGLVLPAAVLGSVLLLGVDDLLDLPAESHEQRTTCDDTPCDGRDLQGEVLGRNERR